MTWLHDWAGLLTGWVLLAIVLSGTLSVFRPEISMWMRPELAGRTADPIQAGAAAIDWLQHHAAHSSAWYLTAAGPRAPFTWGVWQQPDGQFVQHALDPLSGAPDTLRDTLGGEFFYRFHFELQLPYPFGRLLAAIAALSLVLVLVTGIVAHRRFFADFFTFRSQKGQRSWLDAHNLLGVVALPFHLAIALTGAVTLGSLLLPWGATSAYQNSSADFQDDLSPAMVARPAAGTPGTLAPVAPMLREAARRMGADGIAQIYVYNPADAAATIIVTSDNGAHIGFATHVLRLDGTTGQILADYREHRPVISTFATLYGLHVARFAPLPTRWLYFVSGLMLAAVIASGLRLRTLRRRRQGRPTERVERLNVGMIAGTPTAFAAYFLANRLLPPTLPAHADREVQAVFIAWGLLLALAMLLPAARGWRVLSGLAVLALTAVAAFGAPWHSAIEQGTSAVAILLAAGFAYAASHRPAA
ncbi:PepSY domain-containing protein [Gluconacetobacter takamatsuzukensis]|uniref:PepSY domain-containing protein n=2 Tax=Gluconacetobacter takamatsuzukensis TaxID=1286190 RepID=A0A7W4KG28_9PROT|nr:PepSY domain-containing protein [Gluconacetobacter takamatsuzukensis]